MLVYLEEEEDFSHSGYIYLYVLRECRALISSLTIAVVSLK